LENFPRGSSRSIGTSRADGDTRQPSTFSPDPRSVLLVGTFPTTGAFAPCEGLARALTGAGWKVITTSRKLGRVTRLFDMTSTVFTRRREYAVAQVDVFSGHAFFWAEAVCRLLSQLGKPFVLALHGGNLPEFARKARGRVQRLLSSAEAVTTPSSYLKDELSSLRSDLLLVPNALPLAAFAYRERSVARPRLVWVRAFHATYNPALAPRVLAALSGDLPDATLTMIGRDKGDGSLEATRAAAAELGVLGRVRMVGPVANEEVPKHLDEHDVFLNTSDVDNTPVSVLEAMAAGLCVVSTDAGGIPHLLTDGRDALLVPRGDAAAMADAVRRTVTEPGLSARLSSGARERVLGFDWGEVLPRWEELLGSAARRAA
jgi:glycosyltransferase involved in cell wall biosynthesis